MGNFGVSAGVRWLIYVGYLFSCITEAEDLNHFVANCRSF